MRTEMFANYFPIATLLAAVIALNVFIGCSSRTTWEEAQVADTYEMYKNYIDSNPDGSHLEEAQMLADSLYWESIAGDTTAASFETYLEKFPEGRYQSEAKTKIAQITEDPPEPLSTTGRVTGSGVIIRSDHTTASSSAGVVAREGTIVELLDRYVAGNSTEAILKNEVTVEVQGQKIQLQSGKAIRIISDENESVRASFSTQQFGRAEAKINKADIEPTEGETWYQIRTNDGITGWIFGRFIEEL